LSLAATLAEAPPGRQFAAFGSTVGVWVTRRDALDLAEHTLARWVDVVDRACSRFRADSELSRANAAAGSPVEVGPELMDATATAIEMARLCDGWYDPTVGGAVIAAGYDRGLSEIETAGPGPVLPAEPAGRWPEIVLDRARSTLTVPVGVRLDLGGSAKGWAVDRALQLIAAELAPGIGVCVSAGGDLAVTGPAPAGGWPVHVSQSLHGAPTDAGIGLFSGAVASSGAVRRTWRIDGRRFHHLVNPRTGRPGTERWRLVTVHARTCALADTAATAAWLMGDAAPAWLESRRLTARLVDSDGSSRWVGPRQPSLVVRRGVTQ
jgi:thiamine biosynthesis lipoprotein